MFENREIAALERKCRRFRNSSKCLKTHCATKKIYQFGYKRCQNKRKDVVYKLLYDSIQKYLVVHEQWAVKNSFRTYVCYGLDGLFWLNLYHISVHISYLPFRKSDIPFQWIRWTVNRLWICWLWRKYFSLARNCSFEIHEIKYYNNFPCNSDNNGFGHFMFDFSFLFLSVKKHILMSKCSSISFFKSNNYERYYEGQEFVLSKNSFGFLKPMIFC